MAHDLQNYIPSNSVLNPDNDQISGDFQTPYSLIDWLRNLKINTTDTSLYLNGYNKYLSEWFEKIKKDKENKISFIRNQYINLLKEISLKYTTPDEKRFLSNIDFNNNQSLDIAIPFFTRKIKSICQYYAQNRDTLTTGVIRSNLRGSDYGIETIVKKAIVSILQRNEYEPIGVRLPPLSSVLPDLHVEIQDMYDTQQNYYDIQPGSNYEKYHITDPERIKFFGLDSTLVDDTAVYDLQKAIIEAIQSYPFFLQELGFTNFTINPFLSAVNYSYLEGRDFQNYENNSIASNTNVYNYKKLYEKTLGNKLLSLSGQSDFSPLSSYDLIPLVPYQNLLNRRFPTIAHIPELSQSRREKFLGNFFVKDNLGLLLWNTYKKEFLLTRYLSSGQVLLLPDPDVSATASGMSLTDQTLSGVDYLVDLQWNRYDWSNDYAFGSIYSEPKIHKFFPYTSKSEISQDSDDGISRITDYQDFWDDRIIWRNKDVFDFTGDDYYPLDERKKYLLYNEGILTKYKTDIFGNHYGVFKSSLKNSYSGGSTLTKFPSATNLFDVFTSPLSSLYERENTQISQIYVRLYDDSTVIPLSSALSGIFIKYPVFVRNELQNSIIDLDLIYNTIILETKNYIVFDKINFSFENNKFDNFYTPNNYFKKSEYSNLENATNIWFDYEGDGIFVCFITLFQENSSTSQKIVYPKIYRSNVHDIKFSKIYPPQENISSLSSLVINLSSENFNLDYNDKSLLNVSHESQILGVLIKGYDKNGISVLQNYKFIRSFDKIKLQQHLIFKPCGFIYDRNYYDINKNQIVRHISNQSSTVGNQNSFNSFVCSNSSSQYYNYFYANSGHLTISSHVSAFILCDETLTNVFNITSGNLNLNLRDVYGTLVFDFSGSNEHYFTSINNSLTANAGSNIISLTYVASAQHVLYIQPVN